MADIQLTHKKTAIVDQEDIELLSKYAWQATKGRITWYARHTTYDPISKRFGQIHMHRLILGLDNPSILVDHINGDGLDNRRCNLRVSSQSTNRANHMTPPRGISNFHGVSHRKDRDVWTASITKDYKRHYLGYYHTKEDAAHAYNRAAVRLFGEFACLNEVPV